MVSTPKIFDYFILVYKPKHPRAVGSGYVPEQILVAEKTLKRQLSPDEEVRHINGNPHDNRPSNLEIISSSADYRSQGLGDMDGEAYIDRKASSKNYITCKFQRPCWKEIRAPLARKNKIYLPYVCSYQQEGDIYKCGRWWSYIDKEVEASKGN